MDSALYTALGGAIRAMEAQQIRTNNLANINTDGFRADFLNVMSAAHADPGSTSIPPDRNSPWSDFSQGTLAQTGRDLDLAVSGDGWLTVVDEQGNEAYTRAGRLHVDSEGVLRTGSGQAVAGEGGAITLPDYEQLVIGSDGRITVKINGAPDSQVAQVDRLKLVNPNPALLQKGPDGLFRQNDRQPAQASETVRVVSGYLESSNVSGVRELVALTGLSRNFEIQLKMMRSVAQMDDAGTKLLAAS